MSETVVDYVIQCNEPGWAVWQRTYNPDLSGLQTLFVSQHDEREDARLEMRELNLFNSFGLLLREVVEDRVVVTIATPAY